MTVSGTGKQSMGRCCRKKMQRYKLEVDAEVHEEMDIGNFSQTVYCVDLS